MFSALWRAIAQARTTPISVSLASAYATGGIAQIASARQPGAAAIAFMNTLTATDSDVQHPGSQRPPAMQRQRDRERGEYHGSGIGDRGLQGRRSAPAAAPRRSSDTAR